MPVLLFRLSRQKIKLCALFLSKSIRSAVLCLVFVTSNTALHSWEKVCENVGFPTPQRTQNSVRLATTENINVYHQKLPSHLGNHFAFVSTRSRLFW